MTVQLNEVERDYMRGLYMDCLCADCMKAVRGEYHDKKLEGQIKRLLGV
jgi:hypothetical protein